MRFLILKPRDTTYDPRGHRFDSSADMHAKLHPLAECSHESEAAAYIRGVSPDAIGMIMPVSVGSGTTVLLGFIDSETARRRIDPDAHIPFALFVQPVPEHDADRHRLKKGGSPFTEKIWQLRPVCPTVYRSETVELRASDLRVPTFTTAKIGRHQGRLAIYVEVGGVEMSLLFDDPASMYSSSSPSAGTVDGDDGEVEPGDPVSHV